MYVTVIPCRFRHSHLFSSAFQKPMCGICPCGRRVMHLSDGYSRATAPSEVFKAALKATQILCCTCCEYRTSVPSAAYVGLKLTIVVGGLPSPREQLCSTQHAMPRRTVPEAPFGSMAMLLEAKIETLTFRCIVPKLGGCFCVPERLVLTTNLVRNR